MPDQILLDILGTEKQGLGFFAIVEGKVYPAKINDPGSTNNSRPKLDNSHSGTKDFRSEKPNELADPMSHDMTCFFDPSLQDQWDNLTAAAATELKEMFLLYPLVPGKGDQPAQVAGLGYLTADGVAVPLDNYMTQGTNITFDSGVKDVSLVAQRAASAYTALSLEDGLSYALAAVGDGAEVSLILSDVADADVFGAAGKGPQFFSLSGADAAKFEIINRTLFVADGAGLTADTYDIDITIKNFDEYKNGAAGYTDSFAIVVS